MTQMLVDRITAISIHNGVLRIECSAVGPKGEQETVGTLLIPASQAGPFVQTLVKNMQELEKRVAEQAQTGGARTTSP
jgi:hypothetical protein